MDIHVVTVHNDLPKRWSNHRYEVHPIGGEIEDLGRKVTKNRQFSRKLVKLKKSEGCRF